MPPFRQLSSNKQYRCSSHLFVATLYLSFKQLIMLARAIEIASKEFVNIKDKGGKPYILHCLWVMNRVRHLGEEYMIVAILHDLLEDTHWTTSMLMKEGFTLDVIHAIRALTHLPDESYDHYIKHVKYNKIARAVKLKDLEHNSKITRLKGITPKDLARMEKYHKAYLYLIK